MKCGQVHGERTCSTQPFEWLRAVQRCRGGCLGTSLDSLPSSFFSDALEVIQGPELAAAGEQLGGGSSFFSADVQVGCVQGVACWGLGLTRSVWLVRRDLVPAEAEWQALALVEAVGCDCLQGWGGDLWGAGTLCAVNAIAWFGLQSLSLAAPVRGGT
jgi:hypothetical protein